MKFYQEFNEYIESIGDEIYGIEIEMNHGNSSQFTLGKKHALLSVHKKLQRLIELYVNEAVEKSKLNTSTAPENYLDIYGPKAKEQILTEKGGHICYDCADIDWQPPIAHDKEDELKQEIKTMKSGDSITIQKDGPIIIQKKGDKE